MINKDFINMTLMEYSDVLNSIKDAFIHVWSSITSWCYQPDCKSKVFNSPFLIK